MLKLTIKKRETGKAAKLRAAGEMPAVFYGAKEPSTSVTVSEKAFEKLWREAGESSVITLEGLGEEKEALIHDVDVDPVTERPRHADFYIVEKGQTVKVGVPLEFTGVSPAVKDLGGILIKVMHEIEIEALPKNLPHEIEVDISKLAELNSKIYVKDLTLPEGAVAEADGEEVVALVEEYKEEVVEEERTLEDIEVQERGKKEEEGEGEAAAEESEK